MRGSWSSYELFSRPLFIILRLKYHHVRSLCFHWLIFGNRYIIRITASPVIWKWRTFWTDQLVVCDPCCFVLFFFFSPYPSYHHHCCCCFVHVSAAKPSGFFLLFFSFLFFFFFFFFYKSLIQPPFALPDHNAKMLRNPFFNFLLFLMQIF